MYISQYETGAWKNEKGTSVAEKRAGMDTQSIARRILVQRMERYADAGPSLGGAGRACFRRETGRLRVAYANAYAGRVRDVVQAVLGYARMRNMDVQWTVVPELAGEEAFPPVLLGSGFQRMENLLLMAYEGSMRRPSPPRIDVHLARNWEEMWRYEYGSRICFYDDPAPADAIVRPRANDRWRELEHGWCRYYVAYMNGRQLGGCYVSLYEDVPTIMGVYTLPEARCRGIAAAVVAYAVNATITPRKNACCLYVEHGNPAEHLYRQLGFVALLDTDTYERQPI